MDTVTLYLRTPFYNTMERAVELWFGSPAPPDGLVEDRSMIVTLFYLVIIPLTLLLFGVAVVLDWIDDQFNTLRYTMWEGNAPIAESIRTMLCWNVCMLFGGLSIPFGGVVVSGQRISYVAREIIHRPIDLVCLQEVSLDAAYKLYYALKSHYRYFYVKINPDPILSLDSCLFVASKVPLRNTQVIPLPQGDRIQRAAFTFEAGDTTYVTTHLQPGTDQAKRDAQIDTILRTHRVGRQILLGDLNMPRDAFRRTPLARIFPQDPLASDIDYIVANTPLTVRRRNISTTISDHLPLRATV